MTAQGDGATVEPASARFRDLPSVHRVLEWPAIVALIERYGRTLVRHEARALLEQGRRGAQPDIAGEFAEEGVARALRERIAERLAPRTKEVFNLTGTVLHTNLGRAPLADAAVQALERTMRSAVNLEFDLQTGQRGDRDWLVEDLLCELTGAEAATVVNNNAAAVLLTISALAGRREVIVSRGELIEIGGSFRMPDVMKCAGAKMVEVGTTNRTHVQDYSDAIGPKSALILRAHASNFVMTGFTASVEEAKLAEVAHRAQIPFVVDLGSGTLVDLAQYGLAHEPMPQEMLAQGADVVTFSGDKLLGGPQAGLIVGKRQWIQKIKRQPLRRALRVSKLTMAALEATLSLYRQPEQLAERLPALRMLARPQGEIAALAHRLAPMLATVLGPAFLVSHGPVQSEIGSGSLPGHVLPSAAVFVRPCGGGRGSGAQLQRLARAMWALPVPIIGRVADGALLLDLRTLFDEAAFVAQLPALRAAGRF